MDAYQHFGLSRAPFDLYPAPEFFFEAPEHAEALATLEYTVHVGKGCCVVVGESGCGKTLLARMAGSSVTAASPILWVRGSGQPTAETRVDVFPVGRFVADCDGAAVESSTLSAEAQLARFGPRSPVLIVDCADELPAQGWRDLLAWVSNEIRYPRALPVLLFGLPRMLDVLASPALVRLQRRVFRACRIEPFPVDATRGYICRRIVVAGGNPQKVFAAEAMSSIALYGRGNPALINQLCDNAMLEACSEERDQVAAADVENARRATLAERLREIMLLPAPFCAPSPRAAHAAVSTVSSPAVVLERSGNGRRASNEATSRGVEASVDARLKHFASRLTSTLRTIREPRAGQVDGDYPMPTSTPDLRPIDAEVQVVSRPEGEVAAECSTVGEASASPAE